MGGAFAFSGGFFTNRDVRRILTLAGLRPRLGLPKADDAVLTWGHSPTAWRAEWVCQSRSARLIRVEDPFFRSVRPGRSGDGPLGLLIDQQGCHYNAAAPSDLETLLSTHPLDDPALLGRARDAITQITRAKLSKYNMTVPNGPLPDPGYTLIIDQTRGDAAVRLGNAGGANLCRHAAHRPQSWASHCD